MNGHRALLFMKGLASGRGGSIEGLCVVAHDGRQSLLDVKRRDKDLPPAAHAHQIVGRAIALERTSILAQEFPVNCYQGAAPANRRDLQVAEAAAAVTVAVVSVGDALEEAREFCARLDLR